MVEVLLYFYYSADQTVPSRFDPDAYLEAISMFQRVEVLQRRQGEGSEWHYSLTELGQAWVLAILQTPMPRTVFVDAAGNELKR